MRSDRTTKHGSRHHRVRASDPLPGELERVRTAAEGVVAGLFRDPAQAAKVLRVSEELVELAVRRLDEDRGAA